MKRSRQGLAICLGAALLLVGVIAQGDSTPPTIDHVTASHRVISLEDAGEFFVVTVGFSEPVTGTGPTLTFDPGLVSLLSLTSTSWDDAQTFRATYTIDPVADCILGVDIIIDGTLEDGAGNGMDLPVRIRNVFSFDGLIVVTPAGNAEGSFLDRTIVLAEGEDPPIVGYRRLMATYVVGGESIAGAVVVSTCAGRPLVGESVVVELSALDLSGRPYTSDRVLYDRVRYDWGSGAYRFAVDTTDLAAGYYDLRLAFPDSTYERLRIELTSPAP